tara:strand:+ start:1917 stop:2045 length:129 start_codon:yes stop_codon:yes gene_type:complete
MVDFINPPSRAVVLNFERFDFRNANSGVFLNVLHSYCNERRW